MVRNYVRRDVDTVSESQIKLPRAGVQTSYVHSSIKLYMMGVVMQTVRTREIRLVLNTRVCACMWMCAPRVCVN